MKAWEIICSDYELDPPADLPRDAEIMLIQAQVQGALTHEKGGYLWGTFSNAKNNVSFSLLYYVCLLYMNSRQHTTTVGILL